MCFDTGRESVTHPITKKRYSLNEVIGKGGFSTVYKSSNYSNTYAIKIISKTPHKPISFTHKLFQNEIKILKILEHPNILKLNESFVIGNQGFIITKYYPKSSDLFDFIELKKQNQVNSMELFQKMFKSIEYIHSKNVLHLDIKPENFLVYYNEHQVLTPILIDFGLSHLKTPETPSPIFKISGTKQYMSPEVLRQNNIDFHSDIYSLGVVLYVYMTNQFPYSSESLMKWYKNNSSLLSEFPCVTKAPEITQEYYFIYYMMEPDFNHRKLNYFNQSNFKI